MEMPRLVGAPGSSGNGGKGAGGLLPAVQETPGVEGGCEGQRSQEKWPALGFLWGAR